MMPPLFKSSPKASQAATDAPLTVAATTPSVEEAAWNAHK